MEGNLIKLLSTKALGRDPVVFKGFIGAKPIGLYILAVVAIGYVHPCTYWHYGGL